MHGYVEREEIMFETIGTLITIVIWAVAIFLVGGALLFCFDNLIHGSGGRKFLTVIAIILGVYIFSRVYDWCGSVVWSLIISSIVLATVAEAGSGRLKKAPRKEKKYGFGDALVDAYVEQEVIKEATKKAIRELENER